MKLIDSGLEGSDIRSSNKETSGLSILRSRRHQKNRVNKLRDSKFLEFYDDKHGTEVIGLNENIETDRNVTKIRPN